MKKLIEVGAVFGRLTVMKTPETDLDQSRYICRCRCGTFKKVRRKNLLDGSVISCGCARREAHNKWGSHFFHKHRLKLQEKQSG